MKNLAQLAFLYRRLPIAFLLSEAKEEIKKSVLIHFLLSEAKEEIKKSVLIHFLLSEAKEEIKKSVLIRSNPFHPFSHHARCGNTKNKKKFIPKSLT